MRWLSHEIRERGPLPEYVVERHGRLPRPATLEGWRGHRAGGLLRLRLRLLLLYRRLLLLLLLVGAALNLGPLLLRLLNN